MATWTADLCDDHGDEVTLLGSGFSSYGGCESYAGPVTTLSVLDDNVLVRSALEEPGEGKVLLVAAQGSTNCALAVSYTHLTLPTILLV